MTTYRIIDGDLADPRVVELLRIHVMTARRTNADGFIGYALEPSGLDAPDISFWTIWDAERLAGCGALRELSSDHGEVKSMHTASEARGRGFGAAMLTHIIATARTRGYQRLSLETGTWNYFEPARRFYRRHGFLECGPFADYPEDPNSLFMTLTL
jgi:putative acetyltransferase